MIFSYEVRINTLSDKEKKSLQGNNKVETTYSPLELQRLHYADFQFPNRNIYSLLISQIYIDNCILIEY